jgi:hypothetical protein
MRERYFLTLIKWLVVGSMVLAMTFGAVAFIPRWVPYGDTDFPCCSEPSVANGVAFRLAELVAIVGVAFGIAVLKSWLDDRRTQTPPRCL